MEGLVLKAIEGYSLLEKSRNVTVALSGGADSVSLLNVLVSLKDKLNINVSAAHLNHMIRDKEADRDEEFARRCCEKLGVPFFCERIDVPAYARENRLSLEAAAREVRYAFLRRVNTGVVATAHTASDSLETVIFNLSRGSSLKGLCGIPAKRDIFIRPLILCTRAEVEKYCAEKDLEYVTDSTNLSDDYTRNRIRHKVIPILKEINPAAEKAAARTVEGLLEDERFLSSLTDKFLSENIKDGFLNVSVLPDPAIAKRAIKKFTETAVGDITLDNLHISEIYGICENVGRVSLPGNLSAVVKNGLLSIEKNGEKSGSKRLYRVETKRRINDLFTNGEKINNLLLKNSLDCDNIIGKSVIRTRQPGDSIRLAGKGCTKSLKKLFNELKIPSEEREAIPVIADDRGVVWIYGVGVAARCAVTEKTERVMIINASDVQNITD